MEFYDGDLKRVCISEKIAADGHQWLWFCVGSTFALYGLLGYLRKNISEKYHEKLILTEDTSQSKS